MEIRQGPIDRGVIIDLANQIKAGLPGVDVYLFGSYAYGKPNVNSDVDLFIVYPDEAYGKSKVDCETACKTEQESGGNSVQI